MNPTPVARHITLRGGQDEEHVIEELRALLKEAATEGRPFCVGGARHSMGGQSLPRDGVAVSDAISACTVDEDAGTYRARAGAHWRDVIKTLDPLGFSVAVMQSNHDFTLGGTLSVNAHGWPVPFGPFGTTVRSFRLMLADGSVVVCSRTENQELFSLGIGGYGLFGIVLDVELGMVENAVLLPTFEVLPASAFADRFTAAVVEPAARMAYGRLSVAREGFLQEALLVSYRSTGLVVRDAEQLPPTRPSHLYSSVSRRVFRAQVGSERYKKTRWYAETVLAPRVTARPVTRNTLLNYPVSALADFDRRRTDILHEYFVPAGRFADFLAALRRIIPNHDPDLLNVTLRFVGGDSLSTLSFAPDPRIAAVLLFTQEMTRTADESMRRMTERLIDEVLALGGSFYLPYRLHARPDQVRSAYPRVDEFIAKKRQFDPGLRFRNLMWERYFV